MADFTETLPNANSSRRIIDPGKDGPSWFEGLADIAGKGIQTASRLMDENDRDARQRAADARQAREDEEKRRADAAQDALAGAMWNARDRFEQPGVVGPLADNATDYPLIAPIDGELEGGPDSARLDGATQPRVSELQRAQAAEQQGRAPTGSFRVVLERNVSALMAEFPDQQAEIFKRLQEAGFDHYLFREAETDQKFHEANTTQEIAQRNSYANVAVERGLVPVGTDPNTAAAVGQVAAAEEARAKNLREIAAAAASGNAEARAQHDFLKRQASEESRRNFAGNLSAVLQPRWAQLTNLMTQGNGSAEALQLLPDAIRNMDVLVENHISAARQNGVEEETINAMRADWDNMKKSAIGFVSGPESDVAVAKVALEGIQTRMQLNLAESLPVYMGLKEVFGTTALSTMFGPEGTISQEMINEARQELRGIRGAIDTDAERVSMATTAQILRGRLNIDQMTEDQARRQMPALVTAVRGLATDVARGSGNPESLVNGNLQVIKAAMELQPGRNTVNSEITAVQTLFDRNQVAALDRIRRDDPQQGELMTRAARSSAMHLWGNLRRHELNSSESANGLWGLQYNPTTGQFAPKLNETRYNQMINSLDPRVRNQLSGINRANPPRALTNLVSAQNRVVDFLVTTTQHDPEFRGVDNTSARAFYAQGIVPQAMRQRQEQEGRATATFQEQSQAFRQGLDADRAASEQLRSNAVSGRLAEQDFQAAPPKDAVQNTVKQLAEAAGVSWGIADRLVRKESNWDVTADSGAAQGLFQLNREGAGSMTWQENASEGIKEWVASGERAQRVLGRAPRPGEQYVMYQQGAGGGAALLDPANADKLAVDVLRPLYPDLATARRAVTGNHGNLNMTAREFANAIANYFDR